MLSYWRNFTHLAWIWISFPWWDLTYWTEQKRFLPKVSARMPFRYVVEYHKALWWVRFYDLSANFLDAIPRLFADDLNFFFNTANFNDDLARLHNWNLSKGMLANTAKTKTLNFKSITDVNLSGINLMNVNLRRYLGVVVISNLKWDNHIDIRISKARKFFLLLKNTIPWSTPSKTKFNLYRSTVLSVLLYGAVICSPNISSFKKIESFQKLCFRWIFGGKQNYERTLKSNNLLPITYHIELESHSLLLNLLWNKNA